MSTQITTLNPGQLAFMKESLAMFAVIAYENSRAHGFYDDSDLTAFALGEYGQVGNPHLGQALRQKYLTDLRLSKIDLIHSELGEMTEGVRKPGPDAHCPEFTSEEIEAADVFIRLMDYAAAWGLRLPEAVVAKMVYNQSRPRMHGKGA